MGGLGRHRIHFNSSLIGIPLILNQAELGRLNSLALRSIYHFDPLCTDLTSFDSVGSVVDFCPSGLSGFTPLLMQR